MDNIFIMDYKYHERYTYISQIGLLTIKSLMPSGEDLGVKIDYKRFSEELKLWKSYRTGENPSLMNIGEGNKDIYWGERDNSIFSRIVPIILGNGNYDILQEEVIRNILFTTGNIRDMFEYLSISYLIYMIFHREDKKLESLKEKIIGFGQVDFLNQYGEYYRFSMEDYPGNYKVDFEKEKIHIINLLNGVDSGRYPYLIDCIGTINGDEGNSFIGKVLYGFLYGGSMEEELPKFYQDLGVYLINLRKSRINPKSLKIEEYILPDIFSFNEGDVFFHSLLNNSKLIKKEVRSGVLTSTVQTRTGMYLFRR